MPKKTFKVEIELQTFSEKSNVVSKHIEGLFLDVITPTVQHEIFKLKTLEVSEIEEAELVSASTIDSSTNKTSG